MAMNHDSNMLQVAEESLLVAHLAFTRLCSHCSLSLRAPEPDALIISFGLWSRVEGIGFRVYEGI